MRTIFLTLAIWSLLALTGCVTAPPPQVCLAVKPWSIVDQQNMMADMEALPPDSPLVGAMIDYFRMREQARACNL